MNRHWLLSLALLPLASLRAQEAGYCEPVVDVPNSEGSGITAVHLNGSVEIDRTSSASEGYVMTNDSAYLMVGGYYTLTIERTSGWGCPDNNLRAYIDFNGDGAFSESTETVALLINGGDGDETFNFVVPGSAQQGHTRLRICEKHMVACGQVPINACGTGDSTGYRGEVEDYLVVIAGHVGMHGTGLNDMRIDAIDGGLQVSRITSGSPGDHIELFDATGRLLVSQHLHGALTRIELPADVEGINMVLVRISLASGTFVQRVVVR